MDHSPHVMLVGQARRNSRAAGIELVSNEYFRTPVRQQQLHRLLERSAEKENDLVAFGTVGAVALDATAMSRRPRRPAA
jgi:isoaspartyl peptidase/L-asparaginase-like protein (Ntn-hydrolase superfamily)